MFLARSSLLIRCGMPDHTPFDSTNRAFPASPPTSRPSSPSLDRASEFSPMASDVSPSDSVLLPVDTIPGYLDKALTALDLHVEARTSFITYWLPSLLKHKFVALRFVPQAAYEQAAQLEITPRPDVVERIFMLFKGVDTNALSMWRTAEERAARDVSAWRDVVGLKHEAGRLMGDESLFRVLEWGGMEVLH